MASPQHGFRKAHSTTTAMHHITRKICDGINQKKPPHRTILVAIDLSKAFDTVDHRILLHDILETSIPNNYKRWLTNYLKGRKSFVEFRNCRSNYRNLKQGVPQGGVWSMDHVQHLHEQTTASAWRYRSISYADDCTATISGNNIPQMCDSINSYLSELNTWFNRRSLKLSTQKSIATLFTSWTQELGPGKIDIKISGTPVPFSKQVKILGVTFDQMLTFNVHASTVANRVNTRNKVLHL